MTIDKNIINEKLEYNSDKEASKISVLGTVH